jgi:hypothetical protein
LKPKLEIDTLDQKDTMPKVKPTSTKTVKISLENVQRLFETSNALADLAEDILESQGLYSKEFLESLKQAERDVRDGRIRKINSLDELID